MNRFHSAIRILAFVLVAGGLASPVVRRAEAGVPNAATSTCPSAVFLTSDGGCCFDVVVRDVAGNPVAGATVDVDFGSCRATFCPTQGPGVTIQGNHAIVIGDAAGVAHFCLCGTIKGQCDAAIRADGVPLCTVPVKKKCP